MNTTPDRNAEISDQQAVMFDLMAELYPICRSITGNGVRKTLQILQKSRKGSNLLLTDLTDYFFRRSIRPQFLKSRHLCESGSGSFL